MSDTQKKPVREYEKTGLYPDNGEKPFRVLALLGVLASVAAALAGVSLILHLVFG